MSVPVPPISRRSFLKKIKALSVVSSVPFLNLQRIDATPGGDYKALVCIFLLGGNDSHNTLVPYDTAEYNYYATQRRELAVPYAQLLLLTQQGGATRQFGLHPSLSELRTLFNQQKLAFVANVGPLLYPTTRPQYLGGTVPTPRHLFSHIDQTEHWQTCIPDQPTVTGWAGRVADLLYPQYGVGSAISMLVSLAGNSTLHRANQIVPYQLQPSGPVVLTGYNPTSTEPLALALKQLVSQPSWHQFEDEYSRIIARATSTSQALQTVLASAPDFAFPASGLGQQLKMVAKLIAVRSALNSRRQIFFCSLGGFDTHGNQLYDHARLLTQLSQAMAAFYQATVDLRIADRVTTFTASDFGRTLLMNGSGTDHGWGSHQIVVGGAVIGARIYGVVPNLSVDGPDDAGEGRLIPTSSVDQYAAKMAAWFGVPAASMSTVFPYLSRFSGTPSSTRLNFIA